MVSSSVQDGCIPRSGYITEKFYITCLVSPPLIFFENGPKSHIASYMQGPDSENGMYVPLFFCSLYKAVLFIFINKWINNFIIIYW